MGALAEALSVESGLQSGIVRRAREGDLDAFEALYRENVARIHALCTRMCGDRARAEDLTQEVFVKAWQRLETFRGDSLFSSWLHRLAVNVVLGDERFRSRRIDPARGTNGLEKLEPAGRDPRPERSRDLEEAIASLPPGAREVLVLHDIEGYRHAEIAEMTGRSEGTCKAQLHRARKLLKEALS